MHVCALMRAYRGMCIIFVFVCLHTESAKTTKTYFTKLWKQWNTVKGISLLNCGTDAFALLQKGIGHGCSFRMTYSILHK